MAEIKWKSNDEVKKSIEKNIQLSQKKQEKKSQLKKSINKAGSLSEIKEILIEIVDELDNL